MKEQLAAALVIAAKNGLPADVQELLIHGDASRGVPPGILEKMLVTMVAEIIGELSQAATQAKISSTNIGLWSVGKLIGGPSKINLAQCPAACGAIEVYRKHIRGK